MAEATSNIRTLVYACAFVVGPALMYACYNLFADSAAGNLGLYSMAADYAQGVLVAVILLVGIFFLPIPFSHRRALALLWLVRVEVALGLMLAFEAEYAGDFILYYNVGTSLNDPLARLEFGSGTRNVQALVGLLAKVTEAYSSIKVIFSFLGLLSSYLFYRAITICLGREKIVLLYVLGIFPSILFWGAQLGKDPVVVLGISLYCYGVAGMIVQRRLRGALFAVLGLTLAAAIRLWLGAIFLAPLVLTLVMASRTPMVAKAAFLLITVPIFLVALETFAIEFQLDTAKDIVERADVISQSWAIGGAAQKIQGFSSLRDMLAFVPLGAFTALFRPLPGEVNNPFGIMAGLENAFLLGLFVVGLLRRGVSWMAQPILLWAGATVLVWAMIYGFVSYQNLGGGFRYRSMVTPILLMLGLYLALGHQLREEGRKQFRRAPFPTVAAGPRDTPQEQP